MRQFAVFLRGVTNVPMEPYRVSLTRLGMTDVVSFGGSGNFVFNARGQSRRHLEERIGRALGARAFVRTRLQLAAIVESNPYRGQVGAAILLASRPPSRDLARALSAGEFEGPPPVVSGSTVYFVHPTRLVGRKAIVDFERELGVEGTMRSSAVVERILTLV